MEHSDSASVVKFELSEYTDDVRRILDLKKDRANTSSSQPYMTIEGDKKEPSANKQNVVHAPMTQGFFALHKSADQVTRKGPASNNKNR